MCRKHIDPSNITPEKKGEPICGSVSGRFGVVVCSPVRPQRPHAARSSHALFSLSLSFSLISSLPTLLLYSLHALARPNASGAMVRVVLMERLKTAVGGLISTKNGTVSSSVVSEKSHNNNRVFTWLPLRAFYLRKYRVHETQGQKQKFHQVAAGMPAPALPATPFFCRGRSAHLVFSRLDSRSCRCI